MAGEIDKIGLSTAALDVVMPMNLLILPTGDIGRVGPTVAKLRPDETLIGQKFLEVFVLRRPRKHEMSFQGLREIVGKKLRIQFRSGPQVLMKGVLVEEKSSGYLMLNLSFGFSVFEAVQEYGLTNGDFAQTDLAIETLYLVEAKVAVMDESRRLNKRLFRARLAAEKQAFTDALTGLKNRRAMDSVLADLTNTGTPFGLMHLDLDYFKNVNDTFGHAAGDRVLQGAAKILLEETRDSDVVVRAGGDEFVLIFEGPVGSDRLKKIAERIVHRLEEPVLFDGNHCRISGSIGFTTSDFYEHPNLDQMLSHVDIALYASKDKGRACTTMVTRELLQKVKMAEDTMGIAT